MKLIPFDVRHLDIFVNTWIYEKKYVVNLKFRSLLIMSLLVYKSFTCLFYFLMLLLFIHSFIFFLDYYRYGMDLNGARRKNATRETTSTLKAWLNEHRKNPYPTKGEKIMLAIITKMTLTQVSTWFANARRRLKKENKMTWSPRNRCDDDDDDPDDVKDGKWFSRWQMYLNKYKKKHTDIYK